MRQAYSNVVVGPLSAGWQQLTQAPLPPFRWVHIENRGALNSGNDVLVALRAQQAGDQTDYWRKVPAGTSLTANVEGADDAELFEYLYVLNLGAAATTLFVEVSDTVIVSLESTP